MKKVLLCFIFFLSFKAAFAQERQTFRGTINKNLPIEMELVMTPQEDGSFYISGGYYYTKNPNGGNLGLEGTWNSDSNVVNLTEKNSKGQTTGYFKGSFMDEGNLISGKWLSADKKKSYDFEVKYVE